MTESRSASVFIAIDPAMKRVMTLIRRFARLPYPVHIRGETGTGKELVARALHDGGPLRTGPFVAANVSAIPASLAESELFGHVRGSFTGAERDRMGMFELAQGGTFFLDEIEAMPHGVQEKLLRVLQDGEMRRVGDSQTRRVNVRVISASNADLVDGRFRRDLMFRLNVLQIDLPPLRDRRGDLPELVRHFMTRIVAETGAPARQVSDEALRLLAGYGWPGNVRELENGLRRACASSDNEALQPEDFAFLGADPDAPAPEDQPVSVEEHIKREIRRYGPRMSLSELADRLGISRKTLWVRRKTWGIP